MPDITVQQIPSFGEAFAGVSDSEIALTASDNAGLAFINDTSGLGTYLYIVNDSAGQVTCTVNGVAGPDSNRVASHDVVLDPGEETVVGPFRQDLYNDTDGKVNVAMSGADAAWQFAAVKLSAG